MEPSIPMPWQVALYAAAAGIFVLTAAVVYVVARLKKQLERIVKTVETLESEFIPLAREGRVAVSRLRDLFGVVGKTRRVARAAATTFVQSLWNGPRQETSSCERDRGFSDGAPHSRS